VAAGGAVYTKQIRYFLTLAELGSFRRAAERLSISQPALSNSIKSLEAEYRAELFERGPLGARLTEAGRTLHGFLLNAVESIERGKRELDLLQKGSRGHLSIGAATGLIDQLLPDVIARLSSASGGFTFDVKYGYLSELVEGVRGWRQDALLTTYWPDAQLGPDLAIEHFADLSISIYCRASHPLARKRTVTLDDLARAQWVLHDSRGMRTFLQQIFGVEHYGALRRPIVHEYPPFMMNMLQRMDLLSLIPDYAASDLVRNGALRRIEYAGFAGRLSAGVIHLRERHMTPALLAFVKAAKEIGATRYGRGGRSASVR
jgi:DNA-binding transcriptional LysR family regulator